MNRKQGTDPGGPSKPYSVAQRLRGHREGDPWEPPPYDEASSESVASALAEDNGSTQVLYRHARRVLEEFFKSARSLSPCDTGALTDLACQITVMVLEDEAAPPISLGVRKGRNPFLWTLLSEPQVADFVEHTLNATMLAAMLGAELGYQRQELTRLAITSLLQNVGMLYLVPTILNKRGGLWPDERALVEKHSETGAKFVRNLGPEWAPVADVVYQVHEREGGQGYPRGLKGEDIHEHAKLIGLADVYMAMTHARPFRPAFTPFESLGEIVHKMAEQFSPRLLQTLWDVFSPVFVGRHVKLNTGWIGRITEAKGLSPLRPVVELVFNSSGERLEPSRRMDLTENPMVSIKQMVSEERAKRLLSRAAS